MSTQAQEALAAVHVGASRLELQELRAEPGSDEVLATLLATGVCGSDVPWFNESPEYPRILGHELVVQAPDPLPGFLAAGGVEPGEVLVLEEYLPCGACHYCSQGRGRLCVEVDQAQGRQRYGMKPVSDGAGLWGGYAEKVILTPRTQWHRTSAPPELASRLTLSLPLANGIDWTRPTPRTERIAILGAGQQGVACAIAGVLSGVDQVHLLGLSSDEGRLSLARSWGASTHLLSADDPTSGLDESMMGSFDIVVSTTPISEVLVATALRLARRGGSVRMAGSGFEPHLPPGSLTANGLSVEAMRGHSSEAVRHAVALLSGPAMGSLDDSIETFVGLEAAQRALEVVSNSGRNGYFQTAFVPQ